MGRRSYATKQGGTNLNLGIGWLYHQRMRVDCEQEYLSDISQNEY